MSDPLLTLADTADTLATARAEVLLLMAQARAKADADAATIAALTAEVARLTALLPVTERTLLSLDAAEHDDGAVDPEAYGGIPRQSVANLSRLTVDEGRFRFDLPGPVGGAAGTSLFTWLDPTLAGPKPQVRGTEPGFEAATLHLRGVTFAPDFDFNLGGKLPGLAGVAPGVLISRPAGGNPAGPLGWSCRIMWRRVGELEAYVYHPGQADKYGDRYPLGIRAVAGGPFDLDVSVTMNAVGAADGGLHVSHNGTEALALDDFTWRERGDVAADALYGHVFRGGDSTFASKVPGWVTIESASVGT